MLLKNVRGDLRAYRVAFSCSRVGAAFSPGFILMFLYRCAAAFPRIPLLNSIFRIVIYWIQKIIFSSEIHPECVIAGTIIFPHPQGIVIGQGVLIEGWVTMYQGVTLGTYGDRGYPTIKDRTLIGVNAVVLGQVRVGPDVVVKAGSLVR